LAGGARKTKTHTSRPNRWSRVKILGGWYDKVFLLLFVHKKKTLLFA